MKTRLPGPKETLHSSLGPLDSPEVHLQRLQEDLARLKRQIRHTQRLAALGTTAAMLAHEINNLMTPVLGYAKFALSRNDSDLMTKALDTTVKQISSAIAMSDRVLSMAVDEPVAFKCVRLASVVEDAVECLCRDPEKDGITLTIDIADDLMVRANSPQLQQVFFNLLLNAREALDGRTGCITIRASSIDEDTVETTVCDTGCGIAPQDLESVFDDFFSSRRSASPGVASRGAPHKRGTGLGLSICRDILAEHRGGITVQSRLGEGTTFTITLPRR